MVDAFDKRSKQLFAQRNEYIKSRNGQYDAETLAFLVQIDEYFMDVSSIVVSLANTE
jgi:hypothetical protein